MGMREEMAQAMKTHTRILTERLQTTPGIGGFSLVEMDALQRASEHPRYQNGHDYYSLREALLSTAPLPVGEAESLARRAITAIRAGHMNEQMQAKPGVVRDSFGRAVRSINEDEEGDAALHPGMTMLGSFPDNDIPTPIGDIDSGIGMNDPVPGESDSETASSDADGYFDEDVVGGSASDEFANSDGAIGEATRQLDRLVREGARVLKEWKRSKPVFESYAKRVGAAGTRALREHYNAQAVRLASRMSRVLRSLAEADDTQDADDMPPEYSDVESVNSGDPYDDGDVSPDADGGVSESNGGGRLIASPPMQPAKEEEGDDDEDEFMQTEQDDDLSDLDGLDIDEDDEPGSESPGATFPSTDAMEDSGEPGDEMDPTVGTIPTTDTMTERRRRR